jgi:hypothetical protein
MARLTIGPNKRLKQDLLQRASAGTSRLAVALCATKIYLSNNPANVYDMS